MNSSGILTRLRELGMFFSGKFSRGFDLFKILRDSSFVSLLFVFPFTRLQSGPVRIARGCRRIDLILTFGNKKKQTGTQRNKR